MRKVIVSEFITLGMAFMDDPGGSEEMRMAVGVSNSGTSEEQGN